MIAIGRSVGQPFELDNARRHLQHGLTGAPSRLFGVPGYKAGVPDQPSVGGGLGMTWQLDLHPATDVVTLLIAPLIPNNDTLSIDVVSVGGASSACNKTWKLFDSAAPDADFQPLWLAARAAS